jgi:hypothetical protein
MNIVHAQERESEWESSIYIDSVVYKATPYRQIIENGVIRDEEKEIEYYNDVVVYEIKNKETENLRSGPRPTIFMLPGGGFLDLVPAEVAQMNPASSLDASFSMAKKLVASPYNYNVFVVSYVTSTSIPMSLTVFPYQRTGTTPQQLAKNCQDLSNETGRSRILENSYKAFHDFRKIIINNYLNNPTYTNIIDVNNLFLVGSSAGAVLALNALFLQQSEIPTSYTFLSNCAGGSLTITLSPQVLTQFWNLPQFKGVFTMAGAWIYDNLPNLSNNTPASTFNTAIYMLHGTCDEIIHRKSGRIGFKFFAKEGSPSFLYDAVNNYPTNRYITGNGSEIIFNTFKDIHNKIAYGQVKEGGHGIFWPSSIPPTNGIGAWDYQNPGTNPPNPVFNEVADFVSRLVANPNDWETRAFVLNDNVIPEIPSTKCIGSDQNSLLCFQKVYAPTISYTAQGCANTQYTATLSNIAPDATFVWTSSSNVSITGSTTNSSIQYTHSGSGGAGSISVTISRPCAVSQVFTYPVSTITNIGQGWLLSAGPFGLLNHCGQTIALGSSETIPPNAQTIFSINIPSASTLNISHMEWEFNCGTITSGPANIWSGSNLYSELTVQSNPLGFPCTNVRVRPISTCGGTGAWKTLSLSLANCGGGWGMMLSPNPTSTQVSVKVTHDDAEKVNGTFNLAVADAFGAIVLKSQITNGQTDLDVSRLQVGQYKVIISTPEKPVHSTLNISR